MNLLFTILFLIIFSFRINATEIKKNSHIKMNDISLHQFGDFTKEWKLVTVRYRKDTEEMRFTYANPTAAETLKTRK